jgi:hypothetical protein
MKRTRHATFSVVTLLVGMMLLAASAQAQYPLRLDGQVTDFKPANCGNSGLIIIAGQSITINAGVDLGFAADEQTLATGGVVGVISNAAVRAEPFQVIGTNRRINAYLSSTGQMQLWLNTAGANTRTFDITGPVQVVTTNSVRVNGLTFQSAIPLPDSLVVGATVRITGTLNSSNQIATIEVDTTPYETVSFCGGVTNLTRTGLPVSGFLDGNYRCDTTIGRLFFEEANIPLAPGVDLPGVVTFSNQCFNLLTDQFGWVAGGSALTAGTGNRVCGTVAAPSGGAPFIAATPNSNGQLFIGRVGFSIAAGATLTGQNLVRPGANICLTPLFDTAGNTPFTGGAPSPPPLRAGQLLGGSVVVNTP